MKCTVIIAMLLLLLSVVRLYSQSFSVINSSKEYYFKTDFVDMGETFSNSNACETGECILGLRVDSVVLSAGDQHYLFPQSLRGGESGPICQNSSWMGREAIEDTSGNFIFFNSADDSILFKPHSHLNESWMMFHLANNGSIVATVTSESVDSIFNTTDSVKTIMLQAKDSLGNNITHPFNGHQFVITRSFGFYKTYDLYHFPSDTSGKILIGETNPDVGVTNLTSKQVYDFDVGDEFDYQGRDYNGFSFSFRNSSTRLIVLNKYVSPNQDTTIYQMDRTYYERSGEPIQGTADTIYYRDTITYIGRAENFEALSFERLYPGGVGTNGYQLYYMDNGMLFKHFIDYFMPGGDSLCLVEPIGTGIFETRTYSKGLGFYAMQNYDGNVDNWEHLVYYKKGNTSWGTPLNFDSITGLHPLPDIGQYFTIMPNPASGFFTISTNLKFTGTIEITIHNMIGQQVLAIEKEFAEKMVVNIPGGATGINLLMLTLPQTGIFRKKLVIF